MINQGDIIQQYAEPGRDKTFVVLERLSNGVVRLLGSTGLKHPWVPPSDLLATGFLHLKIADPSTDPDRAGLSDIQKAYVLHLLGLPVEERLAALLPDGDAANLE